MGCCGPPQHNGFGTVAPFVDGMIRATKMGAVSVEELNGFACMKSDVT